MDGITYCPSLANTAHAGLPLHHIPAAVTRQLQATLAEASEARGSTSFPPALHRRLLAAAKQVIGLAKALQQSGGCLTEQLLLPEQAGTAAAVQLLAQQSGSFRAAQRAATSFGMLQLQAAVQEVEEGTLQRLLALLQAVPVSLAQPAWLRGQHADVYIMHGS